MGFEARTVALTRQSCHRSSSSPLPLPPPPIFTLLLVCVDRRGVGACRRLSHLRPVRCQHCLNSPSFFFLRFSCSLFVKQSHLLNVVMTLGFWPFLLRFALLVLYISFFFYFCPLLYPFSCFPDDRGARLGPGVLCRRRLDGPPRRLARLPDSPGSLPGAGDLRGGLLLLLGAHAKQVPTRCEHPDTYIHRRVFLCQ